MRRFAVALAVITLVFSTASDSVAARATAFLDPLAAAIEQRAADAATPASLKKLFAKQVKRLAKDTTSLAQDVATAAAILPAIEKKASGDAALLAIGVSTVDSLAGAVEAHLLGVEAQAASIPPKSPLVKINKLIAKGRAALAVALGSGSIVARINALRTAIGSSVKAGAAVQKAGGGGGGGGGLCGTSEPKPAGFRVLAGTEAYAVHVKLFTEEFDFDVEGITAKVGPEGGVQGQTTVLEIQAFDCAHGDVVMVSIPYPPVVGVTYISPDFNKPQNGVSAGYGEIGGLLQLFPGGVTVKATAFDQQAKSVTMEFGFGADQFTGGVATIRNWTGP